MWRQVRPPVLGVHLDSAACSRQSVDTIRAVAQHAEHEAQIGGYVAQEAAAPVLEAGRAAVRHLTGMPEAQVQFTTGAADALRTLLQSWPVDAGRVVACLPGEFGPNLMIMNHFGFTPVWLPVDGDGRADVDGIEAFLRREKVDLVHFTVVGSHRGTCSPPPTWSRWRVRPGCRSLSMPRRHWDISIARSAPTQCTHHHVSGWPVRAVWACLPSIQLLHI